MDEVALSFVHCFAAEMVVIVMNKHGEDVDKTLGCLSCHR